MNTIAFDLILLMVGIATGLAIGFHISRKKADQPITTEGNISVTMLQQELSEKQNSIDDFFSNADSTLKQTENLIALLRSELAAGASKLSTKELLTSSITDETKSTMKDDLITEAPRDYAPKSNEDGPGTLSEEFGFSQPQIEEKP